MQPIIRVANLGKRYRIGHREPYRTLRESLVDGVAAPFRRLASGLRGNRSLETGGDDHVWALRDVTFEVEAGEVLGVVGRNGAGKSTLLKVLSRITEPTTGRVELYGRVGSLLEVGTGFHPELTGRENIFLSGAILGMRHSEIIRKFDEIVGFAEVEKFIDTPVKHFSSGMYLRLAFAVAAHLEPEILLVDEVLAIGDAAFQKKCLGKMGDVAKEGRTVLFVSHNMAAVESLCSSALLLEDGCVRLIAETGAVVSVYAKSVADNVGTRVDLSKHSGRLPRARRLMKEVLVCDSAGNSLSVRMGGTLSILVRFVSHEPIRPCLGLTVKTDRGFRIFHVSDRFANELGGCAAVRSGVVKCEIPTLPLMPGRYVIDLWLEDFASPASLDMIADAASFDVVPADVLGTGRLPPSTEGPAFCRAHWFLEPADDVLSDWVGKWAADA